MIFVLKQTPHEKACRPSLCALPGQYRTERGRKDADSDPVLEIFADPDPEIEIFSDPDPDTGLKFFQYLVFVM